MALLATFVVAGCSSSDEVVEACHDTPSRDSNCSQYRSSWTPDWKEAKASLPGLPQDEDLVPIDAPAGGPGYSYAIDRRTLQRGADDVMRYTVVVRSGSGAVNVFREGLRCETGQVRTYAYAAGSGGFRRLQDDWSPLAARGARGYQDYLYESIMCDRNGFAWGEAEVVEALTSQYTAGGVRIERFCGNLQDCNTTGSRF